MSRVGVAFAGGLSPTEVVECVKLAEELGYESVWMAEGHGGDQFSILTACALATKKILLGTAISSVYVRTAPTIAMATASVDHFSDQRFILGLGSSHKVQVEGEHGLSYSRPIKHLTEAVEIIRGLLKDGVVSYSGETVSIERFDFWFQQVRKEVPIYLAAVFPRMLQLCGELAQGSLLVWNTVEGAKSSAEHIAEGARKASRDPGEVDVACMIPCGVSDNPDEARLPIRGAVASYAGFFPRYRRLMAESGYAEEVEAVARAWATEGEDTAKRLVPDRLVDALSVTGTAEECRKGLEEYRRAGVGLPIIFPAGGIKGMKSAVEDSLRACAPGG
jgi:alkanesulfonate monooxygenase SsuD/methylene tetrahydromethanopterin reductase-like flavin-dependent oxidoreductase (luciferase family)